jgi:hypothetical protein
MAESSIARKRSLLSNNDSGNDYSSDSPEEEEQEGTEEVRPSMDFSTPNVNGQMIFFTRKVLVGKPFGLGNTLLSNSMRAEKLLSDHPLLAFSFSSSSVIHNNVCSLWQTLHSS